MGFLESVPDVSARLKEPSSEDCKFEEIVKSAEKAAVLVYVNRHALAFEKSNRVGHWGK